MINVNKVQALIKVYRSLFEARIVEARIAVNNVNRINSIKFVTQANVAINAIRAAANEVASYVTRVLNMYDDASYYIASNAYTKFSKVADIEINKLNAQLDKLIGF